jgi:cyclic pyranopterin phosphate synthase
VDSLNISLDSLDAARFEKITRGGSLERVMTGIEAAEAAGYRNLKINVVAMRGLNDDELTDFAALTIDRPYKVRFIEYMPTVADSEGENYTISGEELLSRLSRTYSLHRVDKGPMDGPAVYYRIDGAAGEVGFITPISCHFCHECNRIRVTSSGMLKGCLFDNGVMDLKPVLLSGDDTELQDALRRLVRSKPLQHTLHEESGQRIPIAMSGIGG